MFSYYGSKSKIVDLYPAPKHGKIIEPFAGTARYSLKYWDRDVLLVDKYDVIVRIWKWLQQCSPQDILGLPEPKLGEYIKREDYDCQEAFEFMGFLIKQGQPKPAANVSSFGFDASGGIPNKKKLIAPNVLKIKHWKIVLGDYKEIQNEMATWFIDPPYTNGGGGYVFSNKNIDFCYLANWCKSRLGQVIVCENTKANWLPFTPIGNLHGAAHDTTEAVWCSDIEQIRMELV